MSNLSAFDKRLCNELQIGLPIAERPFAIIARILKSSEAKVLERTRALIKLGVIRRLGVSINWRAIGKASTLVAAHIEQKNWTHVRQWLGYERLDNMDVVPLLNDLYKTEWRLFHNFFCPSVKLISKERIGSKTIKRHDSPKTPYQRIVESTHVDALVKKKLSKQLKGLNPFVLRKGMEIKLKKISQICYKYSHKESPVV